MRYLHIISAFAGACWAMQPEKLEAIVSFLAFKAAGGQLSEAEVAARISDRRAADTARASGGVAVLPIVGMLSQRASMLDDVSTSGGVSADQAAGVFRQLVADDSVKAIVLDVDSPGGVTFGIEAFADEIRAARGSKPIVAQVNSLAASAAYWLAAQADEIVVSPGGMAGSIGCYMVHEDLTAALAKEGVKPTLIKAGENKAELASIIPLSEDARAAAQARVDAAHDAFVRAVAAGRNVSQAQVRDGFGGGRVFLDHELVKRGMADRVAPLRDTLQRLGAHEPPGKASQRSRQAFAAGETPALSLIEDVLREAGFPNALAVGFVSHGKAVLRGGEPRPEANNQIDREGLVAFRTALAGFIAGPNREP